MLVAVFTYASQPWCLHHCNPLELSHGRHMYKLVMVIRPHQVCTEWLLPHCLSRGSLMLLNQLFPSHPNYMGGIQLWVLCRVIQSLCLTCMGEGSSFLGLVPSNDMVNSEFVVGIKPGDSGVVIRYQVDEFIHTWSVWGFLFIATFILGSLVRCHH